MHQGLHMFTMGHLMPKSAHGDGNGNWSFDPDSLGAVLPMLPGAYNRSVSTGVVASRGIPAVSAPPTQPGKSTGPEAGSGTGPGSEMTSTTASAHLAYNGPEAVCLKIDFCSWLGGPTLGAIDWLTMTK